MQKTYYWFFWGQLLTLPLPITWGLALILMVYHDRDPLDQFFLVFVGCASAGLFTAMYYAPWQASKGFDDCSWVQLLAVLLGSLFAVAVGSGVSVALIEGGNLLGMLVVSVLVFVHIVIAYRLAVYVYGWLRS